MGGRGASSSAKISTNKTKSVKANKPTLKLQTSEMRSYNAWDKWINSRNALTETEIPRANELAKKENIPFVEALYRVQKELEPEYKKIDDRRASENRYYRRFKNKATLIKQSADRMTDIMNRTETLQKGRVINYKKNKVRLGNGRYMDLDKYNEKVKSLQREYQKEIDYQRKMGLRTQY